VKIERNNGEGVFGGKMRECEGGKRREEKRR
jgi:hypothetical protein